MQADKIIGANAPRNFIFCPLAPVRGAELLLRADLFFIFIRFPSRSDTFLPAMNNAFVRRWVRIRKLLIEGILRRNQFHTISAKEVRADAQRTGAQPLPKRNNQHFR